MNTLSDMKMEITFKCDFCKSDVIKKVLPQDEAMKAMNVSYTPFHGEKITYAIRRGGRPRVSRKRGGNPIVMGQIITEPVKCPGCHLPVIEPSGAGRGVHGSFSLTSINQPKPVEKAVVNG